MTEWEKTRRRLKAFLVRCTHWEFWPPYIFYIPVGLNILWLTIRYNGLLLPLTTNPGRHDGAYIGESKARSLGLLHQTFPDFIAESWLIQGETPEEKTAFVFSTIKTSKVTYPFILKPDDGSRGGGVRLVRSEDDIRSYFDSIRAPVVMQRFVEGPEEAGVFYVRHPKEEKGRIFAITQKSFPHVIGDGVHTLEELIYLDERAYIVASKYLRRFAKDLNTIPENGHRWRLVNAGNHAQGCVFHDGMHLASDALLDQIDQIAKGYPEFYLGRFDVRYARDEELMKGENFKILEVNGSLSEATSIYEPNNPLLSAYRTLFEQWRLVYEIGAWNRDHAKATAPSLTQMWKRGQEYKKQRATYPDAD